MAARDARDARDALTLDESCVRLFVSVDLVGSTAFKNKKEAEARRRESPGPPWVDVFSGFYNGFPKFLEQSIEGEALPEALRPKLVKTIGDELLLQVPIWKSKDAGEIVCFLAKALVDYTKKNLSDEPLLLLKGTAWIAGFPINNHRVQFDEEGGRRGGEDFIGPSIDTGFRITKFATPSKFVISVDLALLLLSADQAPELYFDGTESLKGVLGGKPYPIVWYKVPGADSDLHGAELKLRDHIPKKDELLKYCEEYIRNCDGTWLIRPYLRDDSKFKTKPEWHARVLETWHKVDSRNMTDGSDGDAETKPAAKFLSNPTMPKKSTNKRPRGRASR